MIGPIGPSNRGRRGAAGAAGATGAAAPYIGVVDKPTTDTGATLAFTGRAIYTNTSGAARTLTSVSAWFITTVAFNASNHASVDFTVVDAAGTSGTVTSITCASVDFTARVPRITSGLAITVDAGGSVMVAISKPGGGVTLPVGAFQATLT